MIKYEELVKDITGCINLKSFADEVSDISEKLRDRMNIRKIVNLFNKNIQVEMLTERELYLITDVFYKMLQEDKFLDKLNPKQQQLKITLNPENYFTEEEIKKYSLILPQLEEAEDYSIIKFEDVKSLMDGVYSAVIDFNYFLDRWESGQIYYDINCQRETEKYEWNGMYQEKAKSFPKSIGDIGKAMAEHKYIPTEIAINIPNTGEESFYIEEKDGKINIVIKVDKNTIVQLIDGYHRTMGGIRARRMLESKGKELVQKMLVKVMNLDIYAARDYIKQESNKNPLNPELTKTMSNEVYNRIALDMNVGSITQNRLSGKLGREKHDVIMLNKLTSLNIFAEGLRYFNIDENDARKERKVKKFLKQFFEYVISYHKDELEDISLSRDENYKLNYNMFRGYLYIASKLINIEDWEDDLEEILEKIDYEKDGELSKLSLNKYEMNKINIKKLEEYLDEIIKEVLKDGKEERIL
ncbi:uncharacterized protein CBO05P1_274 [Clostridium botulinum B str. Osaka05]|uniref:DGQHR domain-containing protein n=1 Tax=Clostridium botulinum B str. Osaka05 TaxID=1407017 RepID=A0A060N8X1_CLOBO|nr:hypothetical protein [Clostridium botulinum]BAO04993.1 uncharacterized protein CBO05P1_274 [Clostridium botulinum B str. Osaka05]